MNATPITIAPASPAPSQSTAGKQPDSATPEVPFSQVLSNEVAHSRRNSGEAKQGSDGEGGSAVQTDDARSEAPASAAADAADAAAAAAAVTAAAAAMAATPATPATHATPATPATPAVAPAALLGLAITPDPLKLPAKADGVDAELAPEDDAVAFQAPRKGRSPQTAALAEPAAATPKTDPALSGKAPAQPAAASALAGQLAAARQGDAMKPGESFSDLMSNPAMRPASQATFEAQTIHEAAAAKLSPMLGTTAWNQALGEKIVWMAAGAQQTATLTLNPPNMGPLQVVLNVSNEQATASFFSSQPEVRQALEAAFPRLREMMNDAGIQLQQATVSADTPRHDEGASRQAPRVAALGGADEAVADGAQTLLIPARQAGRGLVDTFA